MLTHNNLDREVVQRLSSFQEEIERLDSIPGISTRMTEKILTELGTVIRNQLTSANHTCSWKESSGKRKS